MLLKQQFDLSISELPKPDEATDALAWKLIGFEGENRKFNPKNIKTALFNRALGDGHAADFKKAAIRLLAQAIGARRDDPKELRDAVLRSLIDRDENVPAQSTIDLASFAEQVKSVAATARLADLATTKCSSSMSGRLSRRSQFQTMGLDTFKDALPRLTMRGYWT